jgi:prepilin-type N-terminal cleavage/methylation domain-containing protein
MIRFRNQKGFTLLEIMLVVLIIGIIALLALPRLLVTRAVARQKVCLTNQSALRTHLEAYKWDWGFYPDGSGTNSDTWATFLTDTRYWPQGDTGPEYCPTGTDYPYVYTPSGNDEITNEDGGGAAEYTLDCTVLNHSPASEL